MTMLLSLLLAASIAAPSPTPRADSFPLSPAERRARDWIAAHQDDAIALLERAVNIPSGTMNPAGVRKVGQLFGDELRALGFQVTWVEMPPEMQRAGHLVAVLPAKRDRRGRLPKGKRVLLIGHLDTVFEGEGQRFTRDSVRDASGVMRPDTIARGAGTNDIKGGDVAIIQALRALAAAGKLQGPQITVVMTGDEESAGEPLTVARQALVDAARESDIALAFEGGSPEWATIARRGASSWQLEVTGRQGHTSGIFSRGAGDGAIYEAARVLDGWRAALSEVPNLTFSPAVILGGTDVTFDSLHVSGTASSKFNIIARATTVAGDLRFLSEQQKDSARAVMREIASHSLPGTSSKVTFADEYPAMPPTTGNLRLLARFDTVSRALGYGAVQPLDPGRRGAGDVSFVAAYVDGIDGLGVDGSGSHSPRELIYLPSLKMAAERAAVLMMRLRQ